MQNNIERNEKSVEENNSQAIQPNDSAVEVIYTESHSVIDNFFNDFNIYL